MTDNSIQWSKLLDLFLKYAHFKSDREREEMCMFTNNETVNLVLLQKHVYYYCWKIIQLYFTKT